MAWWAVEAKISSGRPGESGPDPPSCVFRSKKEQRRRDVRRYRYYDGCREVWGQGQRGVKRSLELVWASQQRELAVRAMPPGAGGLLEQAGSSSLRLDGRTGDSHIQSQGWRGA